MRLFGSERVMGMMEKLGVDEDTPIDAKMLSNAIENAQKQVESRNFQTRKNVLEYDDVMNTQREVIYKQRRQVLDGEDLQESIQNMLHTMIENAIHGHMGEQKHMDCRGLPGGHCPLPHHVPSAGRARAHRRGAATVRRRGAGRAGPGARPRTSIHARSRNSAPPLMRELERVIMLRVVDEYWMDHIDAMNELRQGIGLRAYGQTDPVVAYKKEGYEMFEQHDRRHPGGDPAPPVPGPPAQGSDGGQAGAGGQGHRRVAAPATARSRSSP